MSSTGIDPSTKVVATKLQWKNPIENRLSQLLTKDKAELETLRFAQNLKTKKMVETVVLDMWKASKKELVEKLRDPNPLIRWFAVDILSRRQIHVEKELIVLLNDPFVQVRNAAREALVRLGRGTDFGPSTKATKAEIRNSMSRWTEWLAMQDPVAPSLNYDNRNSDLAPFELIEKKKPLKKKTHP